MPELIVPHAHSRIVVVENSAARLHLRTRLDGGDFWFFAMPVALLALGLAGGGLVWTALLVRAGRWHDLPQSLGLLFASVPVALFVAFVAIRQHLSVADGELECSRRFFRWTLLRKRAACAEIVELRLDESDGSTALVIQTTRWEVWFGGGDIGSETMQAVRREIERRRRVV